MIEDITNNPDQIVKSNYQNIALIDFNSGSPKSYTYYDIDQKINQVTAGLLKKNFEPQTRIAIIANNSFDYIVIYFAIRRSGLVPVLINHKLSAEQISKIIDHSDTEFVFYDDVFIDKVPTSTQSLSISQLPIIMSSEPFVKPFDDQDRPAFFLYTSGSTGEPKGVVVKTNSRRWIMQRQIKNYKGCKILISTPLYHMNGLSNIERNLLSQTTILLVPNFDAEQYIKIIQEYDINFLVLVPPMMAMILAHKSLSPNYRFHSINEIVLASAPTSPELYKQTKKRFPNSRILLRYGLTEVGPGLFGKAPPGSNLKTPPMSVGYPRKGIEYKLIDDVLHIKSPSMLTTYHKNHDLYQKTLTEDGFFNTKDKFYVDENGFYFFMGRADDMFVSGGENIFPGEVEEIIEKCPGIASAAVVGLPDEIKGTKPYAFVVRKEYSEVTEREVQEFVMKNAPAYQYPRRVWFINQMPLTGTNKINKLELESLANYYMGETI